MGVGAFVFYPQASSNISSCVSFSKQFKLGKPVYSPKDGSVAFASQNGVLHLSVSSLQSDGRRRGRHPQNTSASRRIGKAGESEKYKSSDGKLPKSPNQEEIMALLRRIRSSISKGESTDAKMKNAGESKEKSSAESILEVFRQSTKEAKDATSEKDGMNAFKGKQGVPKKDQKTQAQHNHVKFKLTRPPSKFVKKSPLPHPSTPREKTIELNSSASKAKASTKEMESPRIEEMKLTELKELAKSRGVKGYSKLRKSELLELLNT